MLLVMWRLEGQHFEKNALRKRCYKSPEMDAIFPEPCVEVQIFDFATIAHL